MNRIVAVAVFATLPIAAPGQGAAQVPDSLARLDRVVVSSPHFDFDHLASPCAAAPMRLFGFESDSTTTDPRLAIRVTRQERPGDIGPQPALGETLVFVSPLDPRSRLPSDTVLTDAAGFGELRVPPGLYLIRPEYVGYVGGTGVVRVRSSRADSISMRLAQRVVCRGGVQPN